ncbi:unnamed protein product [Clavelina lepadiformis]|uniref:Uncharacterized protein n=1 Tax=Clavelina lepadiformis TaxID=159417 RepID=A0ABP0GDV5_CLALP
MEERFQDIFSLKIAVWVINPFQNVTNMETGANATCLNKPYYDRRSTAPTSQTHSRTPGNNITPCTITDNESIPLSPYIHPATPGNDVVSISHHRVYLIIFPPFAIYQIPCLPYLRLAIPTSNTSCTSTPNSTVAFASTF